MKAKSGILGWYWTVNFQTLPRDQESDPKQRKTKQIKKSERMTFHWSSPKYV